MNSGLRLLGVSLIGLTLSLSATATTALSAADIDRLRMHADAGRDDQALARLLTEARDGNVAAQFAAGDSLLRRSNAASRREGMNWLERAANSGHSGAMLALGRAILMGTPEVAGAIRNDSAARTWFERATAFADTRPRAAYYLGLISNGGYGQPRDAEQAVKHFRLAAEQGVAEAMYQLGNACASGEGTDQDSREAMRWYLRAASLDHPQAIQELAFAFQRGDTLLPQSELQAANMRLAMEHALRHPKAAP